MLYECDSCFKKSNNKDGWKQVSYYDVKIHKNKESKTLDICENCFHCMQSNINFGLKELRNAGYKYPLQ